jgi:hypothetical protein
MQDDGYQTLIYRIHSALTNVASLSVTIEHEKDIVLANRCIRKLMKDYNTTHPLLPETTAKEKRVTRVHWQQPFHLKREVQYLYDNEVEKTVLLVDEAHSIYVDKYGNRHTIAHEDRGDYERLTLCRGRTYRGFELTMASMELLYMYQLNPIELLWTVTFEALREETFLGRPALRCRTYPVCAGFPKWSAPKEDLFAMGDYQELVVDEATGILLERRTVIDGLVADAERVTSIEVNRRIDAAELQL